MYVASIEPGAVDFPKGRKAGMATVEIVNNLGGAVTGAEVFGTFSGDVNESVSATTGADGIATLTTTQTIKGRLKFTITIDNVTHSTLTYDPGSNVESSDSR